MPYPNFRLTVCTAEIKSQDAVYVLAYSIIMLNTDLHNPQIRVGLLRASLSMHRLTCLAEKDDD